MGWKPDANATESDQSNVINSLENNGDCKSNGNVADDSKDTDKHEPVGDSDSKKTSSSDDVDNKSDETSSKPEEKKPSVIDYTLQMALSFINSQISVTTADNVRPLRGPFLAKLEFLKRLKYRRKSGESVSTAEAALEVESASDLLEQYYDRFGDKSCCFSDLRPFFELLEASQQSQVALPLFTLKKVLIYSGFVALCRKSLTYYIKAKSQWSSCNFLMLRLVYVVTAASEAE